jgi:hypothetical protein
MGFDQEGNEMEDPENQQFNQGLQQYEDQPYEEQYVEQIPEDRDGLIAYLKAKLEQTHETIDEAFNALLKEKELTGNLTREFDGKKKELVKLQEKEERPVREKVHEKIEQTLEQAVLAKVEAENARNEVKRQIMEREMMIEELDYTVRLLHNQNYIKGQELEQLQMRVGDNDIMLENLDLQKNNLEREGEEKSQEIKNLLREREDMRGVMFKLTDVKNVLNRLLANPRLLYMKDGTFAATAEKGIAGLAEEEIFPEKALTPKGMQQQYLRNKAEYMINAEDFWYADPTKQQYAKDFGGREHNYNQQFYYNQKAQQEQKSPKNKPTNNTVPDQVHSKLLDNNMGGGLRDTTPTHSLPQISGNRAQSNSRNSMRGDSKGSFRNQAY